MKAKPRFWREVEVGFIPSPLNLLKVDELEIKYGIKLPEAYINLLKSQNGGYINSSRFNTNDATPMPIDCIERISGIGGHELDVAENSDYYIEEWNLPSNLILIEGDGHWWIALDYRAVEQNSEPSVAYIDLELNIDTTIASTFQEFIDGLV